MSELYTSAACRAARQDCIDRKGVCGRDCPHALESMRWRCMIRHTPEVVAALGETERSSRARLGVGATCEDCGADFVAILSTARLCKPCRKKRNAAASRAAWEAQKAANRRPPRPCIICQTLFTEQNPQVRYCEECRAKGLRLYVCGGCGCEYTRTTRQSRKRCDECKGAKQAG